MKSVCSDKNCQETPNVHMELVQPAKKNSCYMQSMPRPVMSQSSYKKRKSGHDDKCQSTVCFEKNCQETQIVQMQPKKPISNMQFPKPAVTYKYTRLCCDRNCQSARYYKKKSPVRPMCGKEKNCQSQPISNM